MERVKYASKRRSLDFRLTSVAQKRLCLSSLIIALAHASQNFSSLWVGHPLVWAPSQYNATYSTHAVVSSQDQAGAVHRPEVPLLESENKLRLAGFSLGSFFLLTSLFLQPSYRGCPQSFQNVFSYSFLGNNRQIEQKCYCFWGKPRQNFRLRDSEHTQQTSSK